MAFFRTCPILALGTLLVAAPAFANRAHRAATSGHSNHHARKHAAAHVIQGQRGIDGDRAREIQEALIREHYLTGPASGQWDASTEAALQKYQADNGWQTKLTPDSRALIKLGLGPKNDTVEALATQPASGSLPAAAAVPNIPAGANTLADAHTIQN